MFDGGWELAEVEYLVNAIPYMTNKLQILSIVVWANFQSTGSVEIAKVEEEKGKSTLECTYPHCRTKMPLVYLPLAVPLMLT